ncbi:MAG TPA: MFS transporter [Thermoleophilia bacterium]|nr:MFS transporter [Thermoleophilia bacterium]
MPHLDRDLKLLMVAIVLYALGVGMYLQLIFVYAMDLGASRFTIGWLNAVMLGTMAVCYVPGAWATNHFRLKTVIVATWWLTVPAAVCFALAPSWPWLLPGLVLTGVSNANNPILKAFICLRSDPARLARNQTLVFGAYPAGLVVAPLVGGFLAARYGMPAVFWLSAALYALSATATSLIHDEPYCAGDTPWVFADARRNRTFRRYVLFFLAGFLAVYVGQPFLNPYLAQVHDQGYAALGVFAALAALGAALLTPLGGRIADLRGPRAGAAVMLALLLAGTLLLLAGPSWAFWALAMFLCGGYDAFRLLATGIVGRSFGAIPPPWGYALFDTMMGLPMAGGAILGGLLFRTGATLPFVFVAAVAAVLVVVLLVWRPAALVQPRGPDEARQG